MDLINKDLYGKHTMPDGTVVSKPYNLQIIADVMLDKINELIVAYNAAHPE